MNHLLHLMDDGRIEMAMDCLFNDYRDMLPSMPSGSWEDMRDSMWRWTNGEWRDNPRDFWNHFCAIQTSSRPRSKFWMYSSARNVRWTKEFIQADELREKTIGYSTCPPALLLTPSEYKVLHGTVESKKDPMEANVAIMTGENPIDYWVPTSWLMQAADMPDPIRSLAFLARNSNVAMREISTKVLAGRKDKQDILKKINFLRSKI